MDAQCRCGRPTNDVICGACKGQLVENLNALVHGGFDHKGNPRLGLLEELQVTRLKLGRTGSSNNAKVRSSATRPLLFDVKAAELAREAERTLAKWVGKVMEANPHLAVRRFNSGAESALWLSSFPGLLAMHPEASMMHDEIRDLVVAVRKSIDRKADKLYLGRCGEETPEGPCAENLHGHKHEEHVLCEACGSWHDAQERWLEVQDRVRDHQASASEISGYLATVLYRNLSEKTIRTWANRGIIRTWGTDRSGAPMHKVGEVLDVMEARKKFRRAA